jgi:hypothetical protein
MVLQSVNKELRGSKASSLYCIWIENEQQAGSPLIAIWIDSEMIAFDHQFTSAGEPVPARAQDSQQEESNCGCDRESSGQE